MVKSLKELARDGDLTASKLEAIMAHPDSTRSNGGPETEEARCVVIQYFKAACGTRPAEGTRQNNTISRGGVIGKASE